MDVFSSFQPTDVLSSFSLTDVVPSTFWRPSTNFHFPADVLLRSPPTDDFSRFPPTDDLKRTFPRLFRKIAKKNRRLPEIFRYFRLPTIFSRFPPTDDFHRTFQHLFKKNPKKRDVFPRFFDFSTYRRLFEISALRRPSGDLPTSFWKNTKKISILLYNMAYFDQISKKISKISSTDNLPTTFRDLHLPTTFRDPLDVFFKKMQKNIRL